jgi:hypothetical protein
MVDECRRREVSTVASLAGRELEPWGSGFCVGSKGGAEVSTNEAADSGPLRALDPRRAGRATNGSGPPCRSAMDDCRDAGSDYGPSFAHRIPLMTSLKRAAWWTRFDERKPLPS